MPTTGARRARWRTFVALAGLSGIAGAPAGWVVTDHLERDNDFCNACHLAPDRPLHRDVRADFDARPPASLAAAHAAAEVAAPDGGFRCIDCHGGTSLAGRLRVKALAAKDAFWYVTGRFDEPDGMRHPLWDEDCRRCHADFDAGEPRPFRDPDFHELAVHNTALGVGCVECHLSHETGGAAEAWFLDGAHVRRQCARCHPEFEEG